MGGFDSSSYFLSSSSVKYAVFRCFNLSMFIITCALRTSSSAIRLLWWWCWRRKQWMRILACERVGEWVSTAPRTYRMCALVNFAASHLGAHDTGLHQIWELCLWKLNFTGEFKTQLFASGFMDCLGRSACVVYNVQVQYIHKVRLCRHRQQSRMLHRHRHVYTVGTQSISFTSYARN